MRMYRLALFLILVSFQYANGQTYRIQNAKRFLEAGDLDSANYHIQYAMKHSRTSQYAKTWHCYFMINKGYLNLSTISSNDSASYLNELFVAFEKCRTYDETDEFTSAIRPHMVSICEDFKKRAATYHEIHRVHSYTKIQELYVQCLKALGMLPKKESFELAEAHQDLRNYEDALKHYRYCIDQKYDTEHAYIESINVLFEMNEPDRADELYVEAITAFPLSTKLIFIEIGQLISKKLFFKARTRILEALNVNGPNADLYLLLGQVNDELGLDEDAIDAYSKAGKSASANFDICLKVGMFFLEKGNDTNNSELYANAKIYLEKSESINAQDTTLLLSLRDLYLKSGDIPNYERINKKLD